MLFQNKTHHWRLCPPILWLLNKLTWKQHPSHCPRSNLSMESEHLSVQLHAQGWCEVEWSEKIFYLLIGSKLDPNSKIWKSFPDPDNPESAKIQKKQASNVKRLSHWNYQPLGFPEWTFFNIFFICWGFLNS